MTDEPAWVSGDALRLEQVLSNLLVNASKYSSAGSRIWLRCERRGDEVVIEVTDEGVGISSSDLAKIFEPFRQVGAAGSEGLGLGLALVRSLVALHGGRVTATSDGPGHGSTFTVYLPSRPE